MKRTLMSISLVLAFAASAATVTRYDLSFPFGASESAPAGTAKWTAELFASPEALSVAAVAGPLNAIRRAEVERWHRLGARVYAELPGEGARTNAVGAYLTGFDGVVGAASDDLAEGLKDVAALSRMNELAHKVWKMTVPDKVDLEGRMGLFQLDRIDVARDDMDVVRLEAYARIRRLAAFAKEPEELAFDLNLRPRPELKRIEIKTKRHGQPTKKEIDAAFCDPKYVQAWDRAFWTYRIPYGRSDGEKHIGYPDPGIPTFCWRQFESEKMFQERCFEKLNRKYADMIPLLRFDRETKDERYNHPKAQELEESEKKALYDRLPDLANVVEEAARLRIAYYLDRFAGCEPPVLPPPAPKKKKVELKLETDDEPISLD